MTDSQRKALDDFLGPDHYIAGRTYSIESDMMALYRRLWLERKWLRFIDFAMGFWPISRHEHSRDEFMAWLFCLSGEGYEERCRMVAGFVEEDK